MANLLDTIYARTIVESELVSARIDRCRKEGVRFDEVWDAVKWRLARNPFVNATRIPGSNPICYVIKTYAWRTGRVPMLRVLFRVTTNEVLIEGLAAYSDDEWT